MMTLAVRWLVLVHIKCMRIRKWLRYVIGTPSSDQMTVLGAEVEDCYLLPIGRQLRRLLQHFRRHSNKAREARVTKQGILQVYNPNV